MRSIRTFKTAIVALRRNIMRAVLTTLGIVIGVGAVIAMMEIGNGSSSSIAKTVSSMGANNIMIFPGSSTPGGVSSGAGQNIALTPEDCRAILSDCPAVKDATVAVFARTQLVYGGRNWVPQTMNGVSPSYFDVRNWPVVDGVPFTDYDVRNRAKVCLIGQTLVRQLFDGKSPVGKEMRVNNIGFKVVGVLATKGANMMGQDQDDILVAPWTTIKYRVSNASLGNTNQSVVSVSNSVSTLSNLYPSNGVALYPSKSDMQTLDTPLPVRFENVNQILCSAVSSAETPTAVDQITKLLRERHHLGDSDPDDFTVRSLNEFMDMLSSTTSVMKQLLLCVAFISLVVGGVGIMNIMLVSVTERTREIGLRMAVGARAADILRQFLTESVVLCLVGGAIGIMLGVGVSFLVSYFLHWPTESSPGAVVAAVLVSATVGVIFGYYPAWKASRLDPIEALRYE